MFQNLNVPLITAFVERWQPETNSFHLPFGEMTITLHDVWYILRIPVTRHAIIADTAVDVIRSQLASLLDMSPSQVPSLWKSGTVTFKTIQERLSGPHLSPTEVAKGYLLWLLAATLFPNKTQGVHVHFLPFLQDLQSVHAHAWGAATLTNLYHQLGVASRADTHQIAGCLILLEAWIYEYFPEFRPATRHSWTEGQPHVQKWVTRTGQSRVVDQEAALHDYRIQLDRMTADVITWTPFGSTPDRAVPITFFNGIIHCRSITEPYMPDRVLRQFGFVQVPPSDLFQPKEVYRGPEISKYKCQHDKMRQLWDAWHNHLIKSIAMGSRRACYATEVDDDYME
ncbi:hypothetical protein Dimus_038697 [Dionaea muscipula]